MEYLQELTILVLTRVVADNIYRSTIHLALNMEVEAFGQKANSVIMKITKQMQMLQRVWNQKSILIIDEISMVDQAWLGKINQQCAFLQQREDPMT